MDLAYTVLILLFNDFENEKHHEGGRPPFDFWLGEDSPLTIAMYSMDFIICLIMLRLFHTYAKKSS